MKTSDIVRRYLYNKTRIHFDSENYPVDAAHACLFWAASGMQVLKKAGLRPILQAGSASWPRINEDQDDGVCSTHFSYVWSPDEPASLLKLAEGRMPEMHVWLALPKSQEIVDFTTGFWPTTCKNLIGADWPGIKPPDFFWGTAGELPERVLYHPEKQAIDLALSFCLLAQLTL